MTTLYSLIPFHPDLGALCQKLGIKAERFTSTRNLHRALQKQPPDFFVGEFIYGWGNNYTGANVPIWTSRSTATGSGLAIQHVT